MKLKKPLAAIAFALLGTQSLAEVHIQEAPAALPAHVEAEIARLSAYGTRFEKVIAAIRAEAAKPTWGWEGTCEDMEPSAQPGA